MPQMKLRRGRTRRGGTDKCGGHTLSVSLDDEVGWGDNFRAVGKRQDYAKWLTAEVYTPNKFDNVTGKYYNREVLPAAPVRSS